VYIASANVHCRFRENNLSIDNVSLCALNTQITIYYVSNVKKPNEKHTTLIFDEMNITPGLQLRRRYTKATIGNMLPGTFFSNERQHWCKAVFRP
jgi:hypothetical protein